MKVRELRGMRDIPTNHGLNSRSLPKNREQAVTEIARLEHEKSRLKRELKMWMDNQKKTQARLEKVEERLLRLQEIVGPPATAGPKRRRKKRRSATAEVTDAEEGPDQSWHEVSLEY